MIILRMFLKIFFFCYVTFENWTVHIKAFCFVIWKKNVLFFSSGCLYRDDTVECWGAVRPLISLAEDVGKWLLKYYPPESSSTDFDKHYLDCDKNAHSWAHIIFIMCIYMWALYRCNISYICITNWRESEKEMKVHWLV